MKTAVLLTETCKNEPPNNVSLVKSETIKFKFQCSGVRNSPILSASTEQKSSIKSNILKDIFNVHICNFYLYCCAPRSLTTQFYSLISLLHSLRCFFIKSINNYFCFTCLNHFKKVILLEKYLPCNNCKKSLSPAHLILAEYFNLLYSVTYPLEPTAYVMGCLCKESVFKKMSIIQCGCIYSHKHLDHYNILKKVLKCERKLRKKILGLSSLTYSVQENVINILMKIKDHRKPPIVMLLYNNRILNSELKCLQIEFYKSCNSLYEVLLKNSHPNREDHKHLKKFTHACISKKFIFPNFRYLLRDFLLFYERVFDINSHENSNDFKLVTRKEDIVCTNYSDLLLLFGFYLYCLKVLKFSKEKSIIVSNKFLLLLDSWSKKQMLKVFIKICEFYCSQFTTAKYFSPLKHWKKTRGITLGFAENNKICFPNNYQGIVRNDGSFEGLKERNKVTEDGVENFENVNMSKENIDIFNSSLVNHQFKPFISSSKCSTKMISSTSFEEISSQNDFQILNSVSTGKEEIDVIDGVNIFSFKSQHDLMEFTTLQNRLLDSNESGILINSQINYAGRIIPTKTRDITKIKGWRNKLFCINKNEKNHVNGPKTSCITSSKYSKVDPAKSIIVEVKEEPPENNFETINEMLEFNANDEVKKQSNIFNKVKEEPFSHTNMDFKLKNGLNLKDFVNELNRLHLDVLSEENKLTNISECISSQGENQGIFQSDSLDDFLKNSADLNISYEIPKSHSPQVLSEEVCSLATRNVVKNSDNPSSKDEDKIKKTSSIDFIKNMIGDISKRKFIWVRGRPIMIEHEKKPLTNSSSKKRPSNSEISLEEAANLEKEENISKRLKITKQLEYNDVNFTETTSWKSQQSTEIESKRPHLLLLDTCKVDEADEVPTIYPNSLAKQKFPLIFPCTSVINEHSECTKFTKVQLVMVINIGYKRPFLTEVTNNIEKLKKNETVIDSMWANIAASAVSHKQDKTIKRYIIPVVSDSLIEVVKFNIENVSTNIAKINELNVHSVYRSICDSNKLEDVTDVIDNEIKDVVEDIIDYVVKREDFELLKFPYDPDLRDTKSNVKPPVKKVKKSKVEREIKRLINVSFIDDESNDNLTGRNSCGNEHCSKGCICSSLNSKFQVMHCGKLQCMFECSCDSKTNYSFNMIHGRNGKLAKDESQWHQTVICKNNEIIEVKAGAGKSKREKKLPTRYRNNVLLGKEMHCLDVFPSILETSKKLSNTKLPSPKDKSKDKDIKIKDKEAKNKDKSTKIKGKDKENKTTEKEKEVKIIEADKEVKRHDNNNQDKTNEPCKNENDKVVKTKGKLIDTEVKKVNNEKDIEKNVKIQKSKVLLPIKPHVKKVDSKQKALLSANLNQILNQSDLNKMAKICHEENSSQLTLADVFVWCSIHFRYSCPCSAQVFILKNNRLVWKPTARVTHLTSKLMSQIAITKSLPKYHTYDQNCYSARTFGSIFNYKLRNSNPVFKSKRLNEIVNNVLSNTNSFIKIDFPTFQPQQCKEKLPTTKEVVGVAKQTIQISKNGDVTVQKISPKVNLNISAEDKKRKRNSEQPDDQAAVNKLKSSSYVISINKEDAKQNAKKKYRIGPAHFDCMGSYRTIVSNFTPKNAVKSNHLPKANKNQSVGLTDKEVNSPGSLNEPKDSEIKTLPKYGLLCLTQGFGYLPVKEFTPKKLQVQDPLSENVFHCFRDIDSANKWLNRFFKNRIVFESLSVNLKWVIVKPGILKHSQPFDKTLLENPSKIVNKDGFLVDVTNINGYAPHYYGSTSSSSSYSYSNDSPQPDKFKKIRTLDIKNDNVHQSNETPFKKIKISSENLRPDKKMSLNHGIIKAKLVSKPIGILKRISTDSYPVKTAAVPSTKINHSGFFRLSNSPDSSVSEGCFIPIMPTSIPKEAFQQQNVHGAKRRENEHSFNSNSLNIKTFNMPTIESNTNSQENILINRLAKTIPINIKSLPGKSILKTNLTKM